MKIEVKREKNFGKNNGNLVVNVRPNFLSYLTQQQ